MTFEIYFSLKSSKQGISNSFSTQRSEIGFGTPKIPETAKRSGTLIVSEMKKCNQKRIKYSSLESSQQDESNGSKIAFVGFILDEKLRLRHFRRFMSFISKVQDTENTCFGFNFEVQDVERL
ncbi:unnamed protein product [Rhizophagus irregularis]|nr:unnamed protein product [Rhizophagus irregularis]